MMGFLSPLQALDFSIHIPVDLELVIALSSEEIRVLRQIIEDVLASSFDGLKIVGIQGQSA